MAIRSLSLNAFWKYTPKKWPKWGGTWKMDLSLLNKWKDDTFIVIFSPGTSDGLKEFEKLEDKYTVLFRNEKKAVNYVHAGPGRNTIIVFELKD